MRRSNINIEELKKTYETISNFHKLGEIFHTSHIRIKKLLIENGVELKCDSNNRLLKFIDDIIYEYNNDETLTLPILAKKYNIPLIKLRKAFIEKGIKITQWRNHVKKVYIPKKKLNYIIGKNATNDEFINKVKEIHGNKYDYSLVEYTKSQNKIKIICPIHGLFEQKAYSHLHGAGCPKCGGSNKLTIDEFIARANKIHNNKYDYSKTVYININHKGIIICPEHGEFEQKLQSHLNGHGCPMCKSTLAHSKETFINKAKELHNSFYSYNNFTYIGNKNKSFITCPIHGDFQQSPEKHLYGRGCPKCKSSKMEDEVINLLNQNNIKYEYQSKILNIGIKTVDFFLYEYDIIIECQGNHHFKPVKFSYSISDDESNENYIKQLDSNNEKYEISKLMGYKMLYYVNPKILEDNTIDYKNGFYKDKLIYDNLNLLFTEILNTPKISTSTFKNFIDSFKTNNIYYNNIIDNHITSGNYNIYFHSLTPNKRNDFNNIIKHNNIKNMKTIHIFEDEYYETPEIVIMKLKHILKCNNDDLPKIMARKCIIKEINKSESKDFLNKNHIQGFTPATIYLGAFYEDKLVGVMSFLEEKKEMWNLNRFASDINCVCQGLGGKLFKYFIKNYNYIEIKSFADRRWTSNENDNIYIKLGFKKDKILFPEYRYINSNDKVRYHKFGFRKQILIKKYPDAKLNMDMTESEMTKLLGFDRIWDCGLIKYVWRKNV